MEGQTHLHNVQQSDPELDKGETGTSAHNEEAKMKEHRRVELLSIARKSRLRWILEAREKKFDYNSTASTTNNNKSASSKMDFFNKVPAASCLQEVVNFLVDMTVSDTNEDTDYIDIEALAPSDSLLDDELLDVSLDDVPPNFDKTGLSSYSIFLEKLKHSSSTEIVNILRKFVTKIEVHVRDGEYTSHHHHVVSMRPAIASSTLTNKTVSSLSLASTTSPAVKLDIAQEIFHLMDHLDSIFRQHLLWSAETPAQFTNTMNSLEKFLFHKLHPCLFPLILKKNIDKDAAFKERINSLAFLDPEHLDMVPLKSHPPSRNDEFMKLKRNLKIKDNELINTSNVEMKTMNLNMQNTHTEGLTEAVYLMKYTLAAECFSPLEIMACLRDISQSVIATISVNQQQTGKKKSSSSNNSSTPPMKSTTASAGASAGATAGASPATHSQKTPPGADDLLPALILTIKEANPPHLLSTISYVETYLSPKKLFSEAGYILTQFVSAIQFLENVNESALTISPLEFEESMYECK